MELQAIKSFRGDYYFLSNFYPAPVIYEGITYQNSEAAFQAAKCANPANRVQFSYLNPSDAKKLGRRVQLRKDWEDMKVEVMWNVVHCKFEQNADIRARLLDTGDAYLEEGNNWNDRLWGTVNGQGANILGKILMEVRKELRVKEEN